MSAKPEKVSDSVEVLPGLEGYQIVIDATGRAFYRDIKTGAETLVTGNIKALALAMQKLRNARR